MKKTLLFTLLVVGGVVLVPEALAQPALDLERLDSFFSEEPKVEVNLDKSLLRMAANTDDPETDAFLEDLNGIVVRTYALSSALTDIGNEFSSIGDDLEAEGWQAMVRVRDNEDGEHTWVYSREEGSNDGGLVVMTLDEEEDEANVVMIDGPIDPAMTGGLSGLPAVEELKSTQSDE